MFDWVFLHPYAFPILEALHVLGFSLWVGSIFILDLKFLGLIKQAPFYRYHLVPWAYAGFGLVLATGLLFIAGNPSYLTNPAFIVKMVLILAAGAFVLFFHSKLVAAAVDAIAEDRPVPVARWAGGVSLLLWGAVIVMARLIPYQY